MPATCQKVLASRFLIQTARFYILWLNEIISNLRWRFPIPTASPSSDQSTLRRPANRDAGIDRRDYAHPTEYVQYDGSGVSISYTPADKRVALAIVPNCKVQAKICGSNRLLEGVLQRLQRWEPAR